MIQQQNQQQIQMAYAAAQFVHAIMCDENGHVKTTNISDYEISCACSARGLSRNLVMLGIETIVAIHKADVEINEFDPAWGFTKFAVGINSWNSGGICAWLLHSDSPETRDGVLMDYWRVKGYHDGKNNLSKNILPNKYHKYQCMYDTYYEDGRDELLPLY